MQELGKKKKMTTMKLILRSWRRHENPNSHTLYIEILLIEIRIFSFTNCNTKSRIVSFLIFKGKVVSNGSLPKHLPVKTHIHSRFPRTTKLFLHVQRSLGFGLCFPNSSFPYDKLLLLLSKAACETVGESVGQR